MASFTDAGKAPYKISERNDGGWECNCPAWKFHSPRKDCKHIAKVKDNLRIIMVANPNWDWAPPRAAMGDGLRPAPVAVRVDDFRIKPRILDDVLDDAVFVPSRTRRTI